jgi:hypothetical protein
MERKVVCDSPHTGFRSILPPGKDHAPELLGSTSAIPPVEPTYKSIWDSSRAVASPGLLPGVCLCSSTPHSLTPLPPTCSVPSNVPGVHRLEARPSGALTFAVVHKQALRSPWFA